MYHNLVNMELGRVINMPDLKQTFLTSLLCHERVIGSFYETVKLFGSTKNNF